MTAVISPLIMFFCNFMLAVLDFPSFHIINLKKKRRFANIYKSNFLGFWLESYWIQDNNRNILRKMWANRDAPLLLMRKQTSVVTFPGFQRTSWGNGLLKFPTTCKKMLTVCVHNSQNSFTKVLPSNKGNNKLLQKINELSSQEKTECVNVCYKRQEDKWNERQYNLWFQLLS